MTDPHTPPTPIAASSAQSVELQRQPYLTPHIRPLGGWTALTLTTSPPIGPGGRVFRGMDNL